MTAALLALVATKVEWSAFLDRLADSSLGWLAVALAMGLMALALGALRWWWLLREADIELTAAQVGRVYAVSAFSTTFLLVGGDVARALLVTRRRAPLLKVGLTVIADRGAAFGAMLLVTWVAIAVDRTPLPDGALAVLVLLTVAATLALAAVLWFSGRDRFGDGRVGRALRSIASTVREMVRAYARRPATTLLVVAISVAFQLLIVGQLCIMAHALGLDLPLPVAAVTLTLVTVATLLPVSVAGFGVREGSYVVLLAPFGIDATDAVAISLTATVLLLLASLPGAVVLARHGTKPVMA